MPRNFKKIANLSDYEVIGYHFGNQWAADALIFDVKRKDPSLEDDEEEVTKAICDWLRKNLDAHQDLKQHFIEGYMEMDPNMTEEEAEKALPEMIDQMEEESLDYDLV